MCVCVCVFWHLKAPRLGGAFSHILSNRLNALSMFKELNKGFFANLLNQVEGRLKSLNIQH